MPAAPLVRAIRSGLEESIHLGHVAVCDADGRLVASAGEPERPFFLRSCAKPFQAAVSLSAIPDPLPDALAAVACASHNGEAIHLRAVRAILALGGLDVSALRTPPGWPLDRGAARRARERTPLRHNCSGKHAAMLLASVRAGWPTETYRRPSHPLQRRVRTTIERAAGTGVSTGVDGCGVPVHGASLASIATAFARLAVPERFGRLAPHVARATDAMRAAPYLVGGRDRLDTALMRATDALVVKEGAEALVCAADLAGGIGIALKVADGGERAVAPALLAVLADLGIGPAEPAGSGELGAFAAPPLLGGGEPVGSLEAVVRLRGRRRGR